MRVAGYALAIFGAVLLALYGGYHFVVGFMLSDEVPIVVRVGVTGVVAGGLVVVASLIWERLRDRKQESFREVEK